MLCMFVYGLFTGIRDGTKPSLLQLRCNQTSVIKKFNIISLTFDLVFNAGKIYSKRFLFCLKGGKT